MEYFAKNCVHKMKAYEKDLSILQFPVEWEKSIMCLIPHRQKEKMHKYIDTIFNEVKEIYMQDMKYVVQQTIVSHKIDQENSVDNQSINIACDLSKQFGNKESLNHSQFLIRHNLLEKRYLFSHEVIRSIVKLAYFNLPSILCDFKSYRSFGVVKLNYLQDMITRDIQKNALTVVNQFYVEVSKMILQTKISRITDSKYSAEIMQCATNVFAQQILDVTMNSINHIIHIVEDKNSCPQIEFQLVCEHDKLIVKPNLEEIYFMYKGFLKSIEAIATDIALFKEFNKQTKQKYVIAKLPDWFIEGSYKKLRTATETLFEPVNVHLINLTKQFNVICTNEAKKNILSLTLLKPNFSIFHAHVQRYNVYLQHVNNMESNIYYDIGKLVQVTAKECLRDHCVEIINLLTTELVKHHINFNRSICSEFESIKAKALDIPKDARSLIALNEYISHVSNVIITELEQKVQKSIRMLSTLLQITALSSNHIELNKETINWLFLIEPIFQKNNTLCEATKSELEEELQKRITTLNTEVEILFPRLIIFNDMDDVNRIEEYIEHYQDLIKRMNHIDNEVNTINTEERLFRFPETLFPKVTELKEIIIPFHLLIRTISQWQKYTSVWLDGPFEWLNASTVTTETFKYFEDITEMSKTFKSRIKMDAAASRSFKFSGIADDPDPMQLPAPLKLCWQTLSNINEFKTYLPLARCMCNTALKERHWKEMSVIAGFDLTPNAGTTLRKLIGFKLMDNIEKYEAISIGADKELALQRQLCEMIKEWNTISFEMIHDDTSNTIVFKHFIEIDCLLEEHLAKIEEMKMSHFAKWIMSSVMDFDSSLVQTQKLIYQWDYVQMQKVQLDIIFSCHPVETRLSLESTLYLEVKESLSFVQCTIMYSPKFQGIKDSSAILESLQKTIEKIEKINESIKCYVNNKRICFGRFFFLSDREMCQILFESVYTEKIHMHVSKCFPGIKKLKINKNNCICRIIGEFEEEILLDKLIPITATSSSEEEKWLILLEKEMICTLRNQIHQCTNDFLNSESIQYLIKHYSMTTIITAFKIYWTSFMQKCILSSNISSLKSYNTMCISFLDSLIIELKTSVSKCSRNILMTLITIVTSKIQIMESLLHKKTIKETDFEWLAQLRYFWIDDNVRISVFDATVNYKYEYFNDSLCIINTTLTDRIIHTIMQAYRYHLYSAIIGPTGSGKTETVKSLAKAFAVYYHIVDSNDNLSYERMLHIFQGLISCGGWVCFDHFHRLELEILSMFTQEVAHTCQTLTVPLRIAKNNEEFVAKINSVGNICIIMDIAHSINLNLPDDLKIFFRVVSIIIPDTKRIMEIQLFAGGFDDAKALASKIHTTYRLLREHFSNKTHYDFGMRSMLTIVRIAINFKMHYPDENESSLILRALVDVILAMLHHEDVHMFDDIIQDLFSDVNLLFPNPCAFIQALENVCEKKSICIHDTLKLKIIQVFESMHVHRALILVGESLVGKTEIIRTLRDTLIALNDEGCNIGSYVQVETITPGVTTQEQLFGYFDELTKLWKDGLCSKVLRSFAKNFSSDRKWLIFDGPTNGFWIENMYTVLDNDNTLYLTSGERIDLTQSTSIMFETADLTKTSPSLLSRCGIIHIDSNLIDWRPYALTYISTCSIYKGYEKILYSLFDWAMDPCFEFLRENCKCSVVPSKLQLVIATLKLFEMYLKDACGKNMDDKKIGQFLIWSQAALIMSIAWGLGGNLKNDDRFKFNTFCMSLWNGTNESFPRPETIKSYDITLPSEGLIQDHFYVFKGIGNWKNWSDSLKSEKISEGYDCGDIFIPTINTIKYTDLLLRHIRHRKPFLLYGDTATGKTFLIQNILKNKLSDETYTSNIFNLTCLREVESAQRILLSKLRKIRKGFYGSQKNQISVHYIDDLNIICTEPVEQNAVLELIRQYLSYGHWYDTKELLKICINDVLFLMNATAHDINKLCPRFLSHFNVYAASGFTVDEMSRIFSNTLFINLKKNLFGADISTTSNSITNATIEIYNYVKKKLLPIPTRPQYCFDIRDISRVIIGCSLIQKESVETKITFIRLWIHEILRVFSDRILCEIDEKLFFEKLKEAAKTNFKDSFEASVDHLPKFENQITMDSLNSLLFGNFVIDNTSKSQKYEELNGMESLRSKIIDYLDKYNKSFKRNLDIVISNYTLIHLCRVARILATPGGNLLTISCVGSGKKSIARLAAFTQHQSIFEPNIDSYYDINIWREDLKNILKRTGGNGNDMAFLFTDKHVKMHCMYDVVSLLSVGEIPELFSSKEKHEVVKMMRLHAQKGDPNAEMKVSTIMNYFISQCKIRLHFLLSFDPSNLRKYLNLFPSLLKCCTIDYLESWPEDALSCIAKKFIKDINVSDNIKSAAVKSCIKFYEDAKTINSQYCEENGRVIHVTSSAFLHMARLYASLITKKQNDITGTRNKYLAGLERLDFAAEQVEKMKNTLTILKPQLELSAQETITTMKEVESENVSVEKATILVKQEEETANMKAGIAGALKAECEAELAVAIPILEDAVMALNTLKPTDITLVKAMKNPPDTVKLVMAAVCVMLGVNPDRTIDSVSGKKNIDYWGPSKRILGDMNFLQNLKEYDKDNIPAQVMQVIKKTYMTDKSFMPHIVAKASSAAEGLCKWVRAMVSYDEVAKVVAPKKEKLAAAQNECNEAEAFLNRKRQTLIDLNAKLAALNNSLRETLRKKLNLEHQVRECTEKLNKAEALIASLGGEKSRWMQSAHNLQVNFDNLPGDMILSAGVIAFMAPFNISYRDKLLCRWTTFIRDLNIPCSKNYNFTNVLGVESEINSWYLYGLSNSRSSTENAIIMNNSQLWCLFVDSQNQANRWIKGMEKKNNLSVVRLTDPDFLTTIQYNVECGIPTLIENVGNVLEVSLNPILLKDVYKSEETSYLDFGRKTIEFSQNFRLYITTRLLNPNYSPEVFHKLIIIDFSLPTEALQDKLLDIVVSKERPELQEKFEELLIQKANDERALKQQEDNILTILSSTNTNILEDENAIKTLDLSKNLSSVIIKRQKAAKLTTDEINGFRGTYIQFAKHCAELFDTLNTLSNLNHMYRFSFSWFIQLYVKSIETSSRSVIFDRRLEFLKSSFTRNLHLSICGSLFEKHKVISSFLICAKISISSKQVTEEEVKFFITYDAYEEDNDDKNGPAPVSWISSRIWRNVCTVSDALPAFQDLAKDFEENSTSWKKYCTSSQLEYDFLPKKWRNRLSMFQKIILVKILRREKLVIEIMRLIESIMGNVSDYSPHVRISRSYAESSCLSPLIFILPSYSSPLILLSSFATAMNYSSKLVSLCMSKGQEEIAESLIKNAQREGGWVFLQNCHLVLPWLSRLERIYSDQDPSHVSLDFRLWLSTCKEDKFPISILHDSVKIAYDYTFNLKHSLRRIYESEPIKSKEFFEGCPGKDKTFSRLLYGLCVFHTVVVERKHFGIQGWSLPYNFDHSDLRLSVTQLQNAINEYENTPFDLLLHFVGKCNYGGQILNNFDQICMDHLLSLYCNTDLSDGAAPNLPRRSEYRDILKHIEELPLDLPCEFFRTDENAIYVRDIALVTEFEKFLLHIDRVPSLPKEDTYRFMYKEVLRKINNVDDKLPDGFETIEIEKKYPLVYLEPLNQILINEIKTLDRILKRIKASIRDLKMAINGEGPLTDSLTNLAQEIYDGSIPRIWKDVSADTVASRLPNYISLLFKRVKFLKTWSESEFSSVVQIDSLAYRRMFLSALKLSFSRKHKISIEFIQSNIDIAVTSNFSISKFSDADTFFLSGFHLSGAQWDLDKMTLRESFPKIFWCEMPIVRFQFTRSCESANKVFECPAYNAFMLQNTCKRNAVLKHVNNYLISVPLPTDLPCGHWIERGTALFCQID